MSFSIKPSHRFADPYGARPKVAPSAKSMLLDTSDLFSTIPSTGKGVQAQSTPSGKGLAMHTTSIARMDFL
jgi:hypothetical protein